MQFLMLFLLLIFSSCAKGRVRYLSISQFLLFQCQILTRKGKLEKIKYFNPGRFFCVRLEDWYVIVKFSFLCCHLFFYYIEKVMTVFV